MSDPRVSELTAAELLELALARCGLNRGLLRVTLTVDDGHVRKLDSTDRHGDQTLRRDALDRRARRPAA